MKKISTGWLATIIIVVAIIINNGMAFGMELGSKTVLTWLRIIFSALFIYYLYKIRSRTDLPRGFVACVAFITAGAIGNVIDCVAYGQLFNDPIAPQVAQFLPSEGGYASLFNGKVVDMLYFPLCEWDWPQWMPGVGGEHFLFFQPIFNVADACLTTSIIVMILFYSKYLAGDKKKEEEASEEGETNKNATEK